MQGTYMYMYIHVYDVTYAENDYSDMTFMIPDYT